MRGAPPKYDFLAAPAAAQQVARAPQPAQAASFRASSISVPARAPPADDIEAVPSSPKKKKVSRQQEFRPNMPLSLLTFGGLERGADSGMFLVEIYALVGGGGARVSPTAFELQLCDAARKSSVELSAVFYRMGADAALAPPAAGSVHRFIGHLMRAPDRSVSGLQVYAWKDVQSAHELHRYTEQ